MINRSLRNLSIPIPDVAIMHDWWLALVTAAFGSIGAVPQQTMLYRQHGDNAIGALKVGFLSEITGILRKGDREIVQESSRRMQTLCRAQTASFLNRFSARLSERQTELLEVFINLDSYPAFKRKYFIIKHRLFYNNPLITAAMLLFRWR